MDENLKRLARELRKETCPQSVIDKVEQLRSAAGRSAVRFRHALAGIGAGLAVLCALAVWQLPDGGDPLRIVEPARHANLESARIVREVEGSLGYIGAVLLNAGARSGNIILKETVGPMQNSLLTAKNKIKHQIQK